MRKLIYSLQLGLCLLLCLNSFGQKTEHIVQVGDGDEYINTLPVTTNYMYSASQTIYEQTELNTAGKRISGIAFQYNGYSMWEDDIKIYLKEVDQTTVTSFDNQEQTLVYEGKMSAWSDADWVRINFDNPFAYSNENNLMLTIIEESYSFHENGCMFAADESIDNRTLYTYCTYPAITLEGLTSINAANLYSSNNRSNTQFIFEEDLDGIRYATNPSKLVYEEIEEGTSSSMTVSIKNTGNAPLNISAIEFTGSAFFSCDFTGEIAVNEKADLQIKFTPQLAGMFESEMTIVSNSTISNQVVKLKGFAHPFGILKESFEEDWPPEGWELTNNSWKRKNFGGYHIKKLAYKTEGEGDGYLITPQLNIKADSKLSFYCKRWGTEGGNLKVAVSDDKVEWEEIYAEDCSNAFTNVDIELGDHVGPKYIAFYGTPTLYLDYVRGPAVYSGVNPPSAAHTPNPENEATAQFIDLDLSWECDLSAQGYKICLGTDNPPTNILVKEDVGSSTTFHANLLDFEETYYWKIIPYNENGENLDGEVWSFTTSPKGEVCDQIPHFEGFEVDLTSIPDNWYRSDANWEIKESGFKGKSIAANFNHATPTYLYSPIIDLSLDAELVFAYKNATIAKGRVSGHDTLYIEAANLDQTEWTLLGYLCAEESMSEYGFAKYDLSAFGGKESMIRFKHATDMHALACNFSIDNVLIRKNESNPVIMANNLTWDAGAIYNNTWAKATTPFFIYNNGGGNIEITEITFENNHFNSSIDIEDVDLAFGEKYFFDIFFEPNTTGILNDKMTIKTTNGDLEFDLVGNSLEFPEFTSEGFEEELFPPKGWMALDEDQDEITWLKGHDPVIASHSGKKSALSFSFVAGIGDLDPNDWLISPKMNIDSPKELSFWIGTSSKDYPIEHIEVMISTTDSHVDDFTEKVLDYTTVLADTAYRQFIIDLTPYEGEDIYVAFVHNNSTPNWGVTLDDVVLQDYQENHLPMITSSPLLSCPAKEFFEDFITVYDADNPENITITLEEGPEWLQLIAVEKDANTVKLFGVPQESGTSNIKLKINDGVADFTEEYKLLSYKTDEYLVEEFDNQDAFPGEGWSIDDQDGDGENWFYAINDDANAGYKSADCAASASWLSDDKLRRNAAKGALTPDNWMITPELYVSENAALTYFVAGHHTDYPAEHYAVYISTEGGEVSNFTGDPVIEETLEDIVWRERMIDLKEYEGQKVHIAFRHFNCTDNFVIKIDHIVYPDYTIGLSEDLSINQNFKVYPNPSDNKITISGEIEQFEIIDIMGNVHSTHKGGINPTISINHLPQGIYIIRSNNKMLSRFIRK